MLAPLVHAKGGGDGGESLSSEQTTPFLVTVLPLDRHGPGAAGNAQWATGRRQAFNELLGILPLP